MSLHNRFLCLAVVLLTLSGAIRADNKAVIDSNTTDALGRLLEHAGGADKLLGSAAGVLVFPDVVKMGFGEGGQYGEGALLVDNQPVAYYATAGSSFGLGLGVQYKAQVILFMTEDALAQFRNTQGWEVGTHGEVPLLKPGVGGKIDFASVSEPVVGMIFSDQGLSYNLSLEGNRFVRIAR